MKKTICLVLMAIFSLYMSMLHATDVKVYVEVSGLNPGVEIYNSERTDAYLSVWVKGKCTITSDRFKLHS